MNKVKTILSALADPTRFDALRLLWNGRELCICELMNALSRGQSCVSRHMAVLKKAGLVCDRRDAQWVRYRRSPDLAPPIVAFVEAAWKLSIQERRRSK